MTTVTITVIAVPQPPDEPTDEPAPKIEKNPDLDPQANLAIANVGGGSDKIEDSVNEKLLSSQQLNSKSDFDLLNESAQDQDSFDNLNRMIDIRQAEAALRSIMENNAIELSDDSDELRRLQSASSVGVAFNATYLWEQMEDFGDDSSFEIGEVRVSLGAITALGTIGYLLWSLRGGVLVAAALANSPTWRMLDMLPVLDSYASENGNQKGDKVDELFE